MAAKDLIVDPSQYDLNHVVADIEEIRRFNPQRYEMEQLTAIVYEDFERGVCVGYKDHGPDEFWARGHMPGMPLLPGVLMCEAAAQMCSYYTIKYDLLGTKMIGFGGMDEVRFRDTVRPGDRLVVAAGGGSLRIERLQPAGKRVQTAGEFLRGYPVRAGQWFGPEPG